MGWSSLVIGLDNHESLSYLCKYRAARAAKKNRRKKHEAGVMRVTRVTGGIINWRRRNSCDRGNWLREEMQPFGTKE